MQAHVLWKKKPHYTYLLLEVLFDPAALMSLREDLIAAMVVLGLTKAVAHQLISNRKWPQGLTEIHQMNHTRSKLWEIIKEIYVSSIVLNFSAFINTPRRTEIGWSSNLVLFKVRAVKVFF